jgi:hypothetical protein
VPSPPSVRQVLIVSVGSLALSTPYLAAILGVIIVAWMGAARSLAGQFEEAMSDAPAEEAAAESAPTAAPAEVLVDTTPLVEVVQEEPATELYDPLFEETVKSLPLEIDCDDAGVDESSVVDA